MDRRHQGPPNDGPVDTWTGDAKDHPDYRNRRTGESPRKRSMTMPIPNACQPIQNEIDALTQERQEAWADVQQALDDGDPRASGLPQHGPPP